MTGPVAQRWHAGHAVLAGLALLCLLLAARPAMREPPELPALPAVPPPMRADPAALARADLFFGAAASGEALPVTSLPFSLHGVRTDAATGRGGAIIAGADGVQESYAVGDSLGDGVTLVAIAFDHVVLERAGRREALWLDSAGDAQPQLYQPAAPDMASESPAEAAPPADPMETPSGAADLPAAPRDQESSSA